MTQPLRPARSLAAVALGACLLLGLNAAVAFVLPGDANVLRDSSGVYDMDVARVVRDVATDRPALRASVHPLQKLLIAPLGRAIDVSLFAGGDRLAAAKVLIALAMSLNALAVSLLAFQLSGRSLAAAAVAGALCAVSFSSLLAASLPESAAFSAVTSIAPLLLLNARDGRRFSWLECGVWALLFVVCLGLTLTQLVPWTIAFGARVMRARRTGEGPPAARIACVLALGALLVVGASELQARVYPGTPTFYAENPVAGEVPFMRLGSLRDAPLRHTTRLLRHFVLYDFVAPQPTYSDFLMRRYDISVWSLSMEDAGLQQFAPPARAVCALAWVGLLLFGLWRARYDWQDSRVLAPALILLGQLVLHLFYGREYVLYSPNWHGVLVALFVAGAWSGLRDGRARFAAATLVVSAAILASNLGVLQQVYREVEVGLAAEHRDASGRPLR